MRQRIGLSIMLLESRREAIIDLATEGDRLGYDGFFMPEAWGYDMTVLLAEAAARTRRIALGTGILGICESERGDHRDGRHHAPRDLRRTLRARPWRQYSAARGRPARHPVRAARTADATD